MRRASRTVVICNVKPRGTAVQADQHLRECQDSGIINAQGALKWIAIWVANSAWFCDAHDGQGIKKHYSLGLRRISEPPFYSVCLRLLTPRSIRPRRKEQSWYDADPQWRDDLRPEYYSDGSRMSARWHTVAGQAAKQSLGGLSTLTVPTGRPPCCTARNPVMRTT
jgi:hypothetical protein